MKSSMNLYQTEFRPHFIWMTLSHLISICLFITAVAAICEFWLQQEQFQVENQLKQKQSTLNQQKAILNEMTSALAMRVEDPKLIAMLASLSNDIRGKEALLARLEELAQQQSHSFSKMLTSLAKIDTDDLWLTRVQVVDNDLSMQGVIAEPNALPLWIRRLSETEYFANRTFREAQISRDSEQLVFSLATKSEGN